MDPDQDTKQGHLYKVLVIGDYAVGKTSIIRRYTEGFFSQHYKLTIGVDFAVKEIDWNDETSVSLQLWDVAGHERFGTMTRVYYRYAIAAVIVFDVCRPGTFDAVTKWRDDINSKVVLPNGDQIPIILLANKCDLPEANIDAEKLDLFCKENGFAAWFPTSAQDDINIDEAMKFLVGTILEVSKKVQIERPQAASSQQGQSSISMVGPPRTSAGGQVKGGQPVAQKSGCDDC